MGCDGGTIPKRHELVKGPKKVEKVCNAYIYYVKLITVRDVAVFRLLTVRWLAFGYLLR